MGLFLKKKKSFEEGYQSIYKDGLRYFDNLLKNKEKSKVIDLISLERVDNIIIAYLKQFSYDKL